MDEAPAVNLTKTGPPVDLPVNENGKLGLMVPHNVGDVLLWTGMEALTGRICSEWIEKVL